MRASALLLIFLVGFTPQPQQSSQPRRPSPLEGPWNRDLVSYVSKDGLNFIKDTVVFERGGVPCVDRFRSGVLIAVFQWFPFDRKDAFDRVAVSFSDDDGRTWERPTPITMTGMPAEMQRPFDPTVVVLDDGRVRLYFTSSVGKPAPGETGDPAAIYSAISKDGVNYVFEPGKRSGGSAPLVDCALFRLKGKWHMLAHKRGDPGECRGYHAVSDDGLKFTDQDDLLMSIRGNWIGNALVVKGGVRYYGGGPGSGWAAFSKDGYAWRLETCSRPGGDATVFLREDGTYAMIVTGEQRSDATSRPPFQEFAQEPRPPQRKSEFLRPPR